VKIHKWIKRDLRPNVRKTMRRGLDLKGMNKWGMKTKKEEEKPVNLKRREGVDDKKRNKGEKESLWCEHRHHVVTQPTRTDTNSQWKPSKSSLIGVWHKDNLYLGTSTIGNGDPHPTNIDSRTRSIRMTPRRQLFFDKSFFSSLENHAKEIISPTHTHTQSAANKKFY